jgi:hypothetical protein
LLLVQQNADEERGRAYPRARDCVHE